MFLEIGVLLLAARGDLSYQSINQPISQSINQFIVIWQLEG